jgi:uncharacterized membrane protein
MISKYFDMKQILPLYSIIGLFFVILAILLIKEKIKINTWFGIRLPSTLQDEKIWYKVNKKGGKYLLSLGIVIIVASIILYFQQLLSELLAFVLINLITVIGIVIISVKSSNYTSH